MIIAKALPGFKGLLSLAAWPVHFACHISAFLSAFVLHRGTMSCTQAATLLPQQRRNVATLTRWLAQMGHSRDLLVCLRSATLLLEAELARPGDFLFILDGTKRHSQGRYFENSYSCGNSKRTPRQQRQGKGKRKQYKNHPRRCHSFICGLLLTPGGLRLPYWRPYYTEEHCRNIDHPFATDAQLAAQMILELQLPPTAQVVVLGDTAYDAEVIRSACAQRGFRWVVPANPERVLECQPNTFRLTVQAKTALLKAKVPAQVLAKLDELTDQVLSPEAFVAAVGQALSPSEWQQFSKPLLKHGREKRPKVRALTEELSSKAFEPVRLSLEHGPHRQQRRLSASRGGPGKYPQRTFWVHRRTEDVHSVGMVVLLFSNKQRQPQGTGATGCAKGKVDKILMSNAFEATTEQLVGWYDLRWQIELFFKECKGVLGLDHYRLGKFVQVEGWVELCLSAFCYLEWYRAKQLLRTDLSKEQRQFWLRARTHDLCQGVRQHLEEEEAEAMIEMMQTAEGRRELAAALRAACSATSGTPKAA